MATTWVQGRCPSCLQETLTLDGDHHVRCDNEECRAPETVANLLEGRTGAPAAAPEPVSAGPRNWLIEEFERAEARARQLPEHARPVVTRPIRRASS